MCGRFFVDEDFESIYKRYDIQYEPDLIKDRSVIFPTQQAAVVIGSDQGNRIGYMDWGFTIPGVDKSVINCRTETVFDKQSFKGPILKKRCIIPASGYFEWETDASGLKIPFKIMNAEKALLSMAGIYTAYTDASGKKLWQFTILTKASAGVVSSIHHRMPVLLAPEVEQTWLSQNLSPQALKDLFAQPYRGLFLEKVV